MRKFKMLRIGVILIAVFVVGIDVAYAADCPPGTTLRPVNGFFAPNSDTTTISTAGHLIRASRVTCGGTACTATIYDDDGSSSASSATVDAEIKDEPGAAANTSSWTTYDPPLSFSEGIAAGDDAGGNVNGVAVYECR